MADIYIYKFKYIYGYEATTGRIFLACSDLVATTRLRRSRLGVRRRSAMIRGSWSFPKGAILSANLLGIPAESAPNFSNDVCYQPGSSPLLRPDSYWDINGIPRQWLLSDFFRTWPPTSNQANITKLIKKDGSAPKLSHYISIINESSKLCCD